MTKKQKPTSEEIVREFYEDIKSAYGTGIDDEIDQLSMNWPELAITYKKAVQFLKDHTN